jgi:peptide/nickel transport system substrate-binding protein
VRHIISLSMLSLGVALLVAATAVAAVSSATRKVGPSKALRGGTLKVVQSGGAFDTLDPALAYVPNDWQVLYSTQLLLVNHPDKPGQAGGQLVPEAAKAFPTVSGNGKTVTFSLRSGLRFDDGTRVTAADYQRAWERILSPKMYAQYGLFDRLNEMVVGAQDFANGKASHISGIEARGLTLTFHLTKPNPAFVTILAMPWFGAVKPNMPYTKTLNGVLTYPSAGPYYIATNRPGGLVVLKRNPYYHGARPAYPNEIVIHSYPRSNGEAALLKIERNQVDYDMGGVPADDVQAVAQKYGYPSNRHSRFHVGTEACVFWEFLNNALPPTNDVRVREAINYALGRMPLISARGPYAGTPTDQFLVPGVPGYKKLNLYPNYPNVAKAEQIGGSALKNAPPLNIYYEAQSQFRANEAELEQSELEQIGLTVNLVQADPGDYYGLLETKGTPWNIAAGGGWCPDFFDPAEFIDAVFGDQNLINFSNSLFTEKLDHAAALTGQARARAYAALDRLLMTKYAPVFPLYIPNFRYLVSKRVHDIVFSHYYGGPILNAMSVG